MRKRILIKHGQLWLDNICLVPIVSGKASFAHYIKELFLNLSFDCLAVGLPVSFYPLILQGIQSLPYITVILGQEKNGGYQYLPIDPCDGMIEAIRLCMQEGYPIKCIDHEMSSLSHYLPEKSAEPSPPTSGLILPDEFAIQKIGFPPYIQALFLKFFLEQAEDQRQAKKEDLQARFMAFQLQELSLEYHKVLFVFSVHHLPAILHDYQTEFGAVSPGERLKDIKLYSVHPDSLYSILGEIPYLTYLYEKLKGIISFEEFEKIDGLKKLLLETRKAYHEKLPEEIYRIGLHDLQTVLQFMRNLCLLKNRLTPDLYELVIAAKGVIGNDFTLKLIETAKFYPYLDINPPYPTIKMTDRSVRLDQTIFPACRRVPTLAKEWKRIKLEKKPTPRQMRQWKTHWNPNTVCSWPTEDEIIENFCGYVRKRALKLVGLSQVRTEEFKSTLKDGIHIRETIRNLHMGKIYVKEEPQIHGDVGAVIFIFDDDPEGLKYPYKLTWLAEHQNESTLAFYATDLKENPVGPGIARCFYGGALFIYPPQFIADVWKDARFDEASNDAERLMMAGIYYSEEYYVAVIARKRPSLFIHDYARLQQKKLVFLPLSSFSHPTLQKLRYFHVLNGKQVRSWAAYYIRTVS